MSTERVEQVREWLAAATASEQEVGPYYRHNVVVNIIHALPDLLAEHEALAARVAKLESVREWAVSVVASRQVQQTFPGAYRLLTTVDDMAMKGLAQALAALEGRTDG